MRLDGIARGLVLAAVDGEWTEAAIVARMANALGTEPRAWMARLAARLLPIGPSDLRALEEIVRDRLPQRPGQRARMVRRWHLPPLVTTPTRFDVPELTSEPALAALLEIPSTHLAWYADTAGMNRRAAAERLRHYSYRCVPKRTMGVRLLEAPKPVLKRAQRHLLERVLSHVPVHPSATGFVRGRSVATHASAHVGARVVVRLDLVNFFWHVDARRVRGIFRALGYPAPIDRLLAGIATTRTPPAVCREVSASISDPTERHSLHTLLSGRHLPQGAPSSPAIANLCAFGLDRRLAGLAARFGARYTRYADDLAFSGDASFERGLDRFLPRVGAIAILEGFRIRHHKTRVMRSGARQELCGVVVNEKLSPRRAELERLEATLVNAIRTGPAAQNRAALPDFRAHLGGRVAWVQHLDRAKGDRLLALFQRIDWT